MNQVSHVLKINGMTCGGCSGRVQRVLEATPGVIQADISHVSNAGIIITDSSLTTQQLIEVVKSTGFDVTA
ncbi:MAG: heavy-metal-associated domain-containing protein [Candidatus Poseidoniaceae archaeon]|jgi:copper chaperone CopZ